MSLEVKTQLVLEWDIELDIACIYVYYVCMIILFHLLIFLSDIAAVIVFYLAMYIFARNAGERVIEAEGLQYLFV